MVPMPSRPLAAYRSPLPWRPSSRALTRWWPPSFLLCISGLMAASSPRPLAPPSSPSIADLHLISFCRGSFFLGSQPPIEIWRETRTRRPRRKRAC
ncbi:hypothetical protein ACQJBY_069380 [Aegilops geniculata]